MAADDRSQEVVAVDLGSNSFHLVVAREQGADLQVLDRLREPVRIAAGLDEEKRLSTAAQERALACLERFGQRLAGIPRRPDPPPVHTAEPEQKGERRFTLQGDTQPIFAMAFHRPNTTHPDDPALAVLARVFGQGRTSRLYERLVKKEKSALFAGAFPEFPGNKYPSLFIVFAIPNSGHTPDAIEKVGWEEIKRLQDELIDADELARVKTEVRAEFIRGIESNSGLAGQLAAYETLRGGWEELFKEVGRIEAVTREDVQAMARKYLQRQNATIGAMVTEERRAETGAQGK